MTKMTPETNKLAKQSPSSVTSCKKLIQAARSNPMQQALAEERNLFVDLFDTEDQSEGVNAFLEKRTPNGKTDKENTL